MKLISRTSVAVASGLLALSTVVACDTWIDLGGNVHHHTGPGGSGGGGTTGSTGGSGGGCAPGATASCYEGPVSTEGVGLCKAGLKTCNADGSAYGPCFGEVKPEIENCAIAVDEDCDGLAQPCKGTPLWSERAGDATHQHAWGLAVDSAGDVLVTGDFTGKMELGGCELAKVGDPGLFVAKLNPSGACLWAKSAGDAGSQYGLAVAIDVDGNILVSGDFTDAMGLVGCPLTNVGSSGLFVAKLDPSSGACLWSKTAGNAHGSSVAVDGTSNVVLTGSFYGDMALDGCPTLSTAGVLDFFVAKLDPSGVCLWSKGAGDAMIQSGEGVAIDSEENIVVTGNFNGAMDLGGCKLLNTGTTEMFVAKLNASGTCLWSEAGLDASGSIGRGVAIDGARNVLLTGDFIETMNVGKCTLARSGSAGFFVTKLDPSGGCLWSKSTLDAGAQSSKGVAVDAFNNVLVTGNFLDSLNLGGGSMVSAGDQDVFWVKLDAEGSYLWGQRGGGAFSDSGKGVAADSTGNVVLTGNFHGTVDFGTGPLVSAGGADIFVAKFGP